MPDINLGSAENENVTLTVEQVNVLQAVSPRIISITKVTGATEVTVEDILGIHTLSIPDGIEGKPGVGIASAVLNQDYTLTLTFTDGTSYTTPSLRGANGEGVPAGGTTGQVMSKASDADFDTEWVDPPQTVEIDPTLTISGEAADAKATGDAIRAMCPVATVGPSAIVSVDDAVPLDAEGLVAQIEPVQDLHGYDNPWPAGGGKNLLMLKTSAETINGVTFAPQADGTIKVNGTATNLASYTIGSYSASAGTYGFSGCPSNPSGYRQQWKLNGAGTGFDTGSETTKTLSESGTLTAEIVVMSGTQMNNVIFKPMIRDTSVGDSSFAPYSNICPISGWTGAMVQRTGKNLFDINGSTSLIYDGIAIQDNRIVISSIGSGATSRVYFSTLYEPGTYTFSGKYSGDIQEVRILSTKSFIGGTYNAYYGGYYKALSNGSITITTTEQFAIGVIAQGNARGQGALYDLQFELGSTATSYEPYTSTTIPVTFPASAGTVYGGYVDLLNGKLVVDRARVDMGTLNWAINGRRFLVQLMGAKGSATDASVANIVCSCYKAVTNNQTYGGTAVGISLNKDDDAYCGIYDPTYEDLATFKSAISNQTLVYELATPITYDISPVTLTLLRGDNNIWADTGATTLTYRQDVAILLSKLTAQVAALNSAVTNS